MKVPFRIGLSSALLFISTLSSFSTNAAAADSFDPIGGQHIAVFRPSNGTWYVRNRATGAVRTQQWGVAGDIPVPADYDGDGTTDFAIWRPSDGTWWVIDSSTGQGHWWQWGQKGDVPVPGVYSTGKVEFAVWRPSNGTWYRLNRQTGATVAKQWGQNGDVPVLGSFSTGGNPLLFPMPAYTVWRPSNGNWYVSEVWGTTKTPRQWGASTDKPVAADYNGDGVTDFATWRPSNGTWYKIASNFYTSPAGGTVQSQQWGMVGDVPMPFDYDGDARADSTVWRPSNGTWYIIKSKTGQTESHQWGMVGDVPVSYYVSPPAPIIK